jgi:hypothetical protein
MTMEDKERGAGKVWMGKEKTFGMIFIVMQ